MTTRITIHGAQPDDLAEIGRMIASVRDKCPGSDFVIVRSRSTGRKCVVSRTKCGWSASLETEEESNNG